MAEELSKPVKGVAILQDMGRDKIAARDGRSVARKLESTEHADGRYVVGGRGGHDRPVLVQKIGCDTQGFDAPAEKLLVDGTSQTLLSLSPNQSVSIPLNAAMPAGDPVPPRAEAAQPAAPSAIPTMPVEASPVHRDLAQATIVAKAVVAAPVRKMVTIQGQGLGKLRVFCHSVVISSKLLVLAYPMDGSTSIVEPPKTQGLDTLLTITVDGKDYQCASYDMSFEFDGLLMVVLPRADG